MAHPGCHSASVHLRTVPARKDQGNRDRGTFVQWKSCSRPRLGPLSGHVKRHVWAVRGACSAEEGEETRWRERRQGGGREVEVGEWPRVVVDGLGRSGVGIVGEMGVCSLM